MHLCVLVCAYLPSLTAHGRRVWLGRQSFAQGPPDRAPLCWFDLWPLSCRWGWGVSVPQGCSFSLLESHHGGCMECKGRCEGCMHVKTQLQQSACVAHEHNPYCTVYVSASPWADQKSLSWPPNDWGICVQLYTSLLTTCRYYSVTKWPRFCLAAMEKIILSTAIR